MAEDQDWRKLCEAAVQEKDPAKLLQITEQINRILAEREKDSRNRGVKRAKGKK